MLFYLLNQKVSACLFLEDEFPYKQAFVCDTLRPLIMFQTELGGLGFTLPTSSCRIIGPNGCLQRYFLKPVLKGWENVPHKHLGFENLV